MVLVQKWPFFQVFFLGNIGQENVFYDNLERKKRLFRLYKQEVEKLEKSTFFSKGLTHGFGPKMADFSTFFFRQYRPGKCLLRYSITKKRPTRLKTQEVKKCEKLTFFQRG